MPRGHLARARGGLCAAAAILAIGLGAPVAAESISVSPTKLAVPGGGQQTTLTVTAAGDRQSVVQVRVMAWNPRHAPDKLKPTRDVVVSPPISQLAPRQELTVRIVRTRNRPVRGQECYRVLVDRLPSGPVNDQAIALRIRHSVPLCFS